MVHKVLYVEGPHINDRGESRGRGPDKVAEAIQNVYDTAEKLGEIVSKEIFTIPLSDAPNESGTDVMFYVVKLRDPGAA